MDNNGYTPKPDPGRSYVQAFRPYVDSTKAWRTREKQHAVREWQAERAANALRQASHRALCQGATSAEQHQEGEQLRRSRDAGAHLNIAALSAKRRSLKLLDERRPGAHRRTRPSMWMQIPSSPSLATRQHLLCAATLGYLNFLPLALPGWAPPRWGPTWTRVSRASPKKAP